MSKPLFSQQNADSAGGRKKKPASGERAGASVGREDSGTDPEAPDRENSRAGEPVPEIPAAAAQRPPDRAVKRSDPAGRGRSRITQAVLKIQREALRALARETPPRKKAAPVREEAVPEPGLAVGLAESERATLVEVMDALDRPLLCMAPETALRQGLRIRTVAVALLTAESKVLLTRRTNEKLGSQGRWDVDTVFVLVGEAREDAANRCLAMAPLQGLKPALVAEAEENSGLSCRLSLFTAHLPPGLYPWSPLLEALEVDADELDGLVRDTPDLLTPELIWAAGTGLLFGGGGKRAK